VTARQCVPFGKKCRRRLNSASVAAGHLTIIAGTAPTDVTVFGPLPLGTVIWSNPGGGLVIRRRIMRRGMSAWCRCNPLV